MKVYLLELQARYLKRFVTAGIFSSKAKAEKAIELFPKNRNFLLTEVPVNKIVMTKDGEDNATIRV